MMVLAFCGQLCFQMKFCAIFCCSVKNIARILIEIALIILSNMDILMLLILSIQNHDKFLHLLMSTIYFSMFCNFPLEVLYFFGIFDIKSKAFNLALNPRYLRFFSTILKGTLLTSSFFQLCICLYWGH